MAAECALCAAPDEVALATELVTDGGRLVAVVENTKDEEGPVAATVVLFSTNTCGE